jgi:hypothetical protein
MENKTNQADNIERLKFEVGQEMGLNWEKKNNNIKKKIK